MKPLSWIVALAIVHAFGELSRADIQVLSAADHQFQAGAHNQGWFKEAGGINSYSGNYFTGALHSVNPAFETPSRGFFSFYMGDVHLPARGATLVLDRGWERGSEVDNELTETVEFFDVTTPADFLNTTNTFVAGVFADLGTGNSYGVFDVPRNSNGSSGLILRIPLNDAALADINARPSAAYFSIGCDLITNDGFDGVFGFTEAIPATLELTLIPEPTGVALCLTCGLAGCAGRRSRLARR